MPPTLRRHCMSFAVFVVRFFIGMRNLRRHASQVPPPFVQGSSTQHHYQRLHRFVDIVNLLSSWSFEDTVNLLSSWSFVDAANLACFCQPRSRAAVVAVGSFELPTFRYSHPSFHCHLFVERCRQPYVTACHLLSSSFSSSTCAIFVAMHLKCHRLLCKDFQLNITINVFISLLIMLTFCHHGPRFIVITPAMDSSMPRTFISSCAVVFASHASHRSLTSPSWTCLAQSSLYFLSSCHCRRHHTDGSRKRERRATEKPNDARLARPFELMYLRTRFRIYIKLINMFNGMVSSLRYC